MGYGHWDTNGDGHLDGFEADRFMIDNHLYEGQQGGGGGGGGGYGGGAGGGSSSGDDDSGPLGCLGYTSLGLGVVAMWAALTLCLIFVAFILWILFGAAIGVSGDSAGAIWWVIIIGSAVVAAAIIYFKAFKIG